MLKKMPYCVVLLLFTINSFACTTFFINNNGQMVFGRNYDWVTGTGMINTNLRGLFKTSVKLGESSTISWVSQYGSLTFNQYGKEFPTGGMNDKGLVVELMWLDGTVYPAADERAAVGVLQWIQYQLDNSATIDDVIASDKKIRISEKGTPLHYLVADAHGNAATIEFISGGMKIHKDAQLPLAVLTNGTYESSIGIAKTEKANSEKSFQDNSLDRFVKACRMVEQVQASKEIKELIPYSFSILDKVSQGNFTKWSIVYDISNLKVYFKTSAEENVRSFSFGAFNFSCNSNAVSYSLDNHGKGNISGEFISYPKELSRKLLQRAADESSQYVKITAKEIDELINYPSSVSCK
jgi:penicillin V acylase-like amidase (Ntn superfamily)